MLTNKLMGAAGGADKVYVEDVFSTYLYTGNGGSQTINNGIALADGFSLTPGTALAGGYFGGFISTSGNGVATHALIVAPKSSGENSTRQWKTANTSTAGTSSLIDGPANSAAMNDASHPAAQFCEGLTIGGYSDWYMPAKNELEVLYYFLKPTTTANNTSYGSNANAVSPQPINTNYTTGSPAQTSATAFRSGGAEAFAAGYYWSSTESSATDAWDQDFYNGLQSDDSKGYSFYVRAVRRVAIADAILDPYRVAGKGGLVWLKSRSAATDHALYDTARGATFDLVSNSTAAQTTQSTGLTAFGSTGFSIGALAKINTNAATYASWTFREQAKFFDVVTYTGNGANRTVAHNLGSVPGMIIVKRTNGVADWQVYHRSLANTEYMVLNTTAAKATGTTRWNSTTPTDSVFSLGTDATVNASGGTYVAYLFAHDAGGFGASGTDNVISCGIFGTDGGGNASVTLGYEPQWILARPITGGANWILVDTMRGWDLSSSDRGLCPNLASAEFSYSSGNPTSTGFIYSDIGIPNTAYIYIAIRRGPMKTPTSGASVFSPVARTGTGAAVNVISGIVVDSALVLRRTTVSYPVFFDRLRGLEKALYTYSDTNELNQPSTLTSFASNTGVSYGTDSAQAVNISGNNFINYFLQRAPGFFDVVCYTGDGNSFNTIYHNLGVAPGFLIVKRRNSNGNWVTAFHQGTGFSASYWNSLNTTISGIAPGNDGYIDTITSVFFRVYSYFTLNDVNVAGSTYVAYLFASCPGVSKVGSYTGTGAAQTINCGFTAGARFVLIKRTDSTGDWYTWDSARGIIAGNDPHLSLNTAAAEVTTNDSIDPDSTGFIVNQVAATDINVSAATYIYLAIA